MNEPRLLVHEPPGTPRGIALVLHGGRSRSRRPVHATNLAVLRMLPFAWSLEHADAGLVVARLHYRVRGWNGAERSPVPDTEWALEQLTARFPGVPVALLGHSMGGRTAMYVAAHDSVRVVVGLAPWIEPGDPVRPLAGRRVLIAHGDHDRMTDAGSSAAYARAAERVAESVSYVTVRGDSHAMLRRAPVWSELGTGFVVGALFEDARAESPAGVVAEALAGTPSLAV